MAYAWWRWSAQLPPPSNYGSNLTVFETQQMPVESVTQPNATNSALEAKKRSKSGVTQPNGTNSALKAKKNSKNEARKRQKLKKARREEAKRKKKELAVQNKLREMFPNAGMKELNDARKQNLAKKQLRKQNITRRLEAKQQRQQMIINEKVSETRADMQELVEAEKQKAERFLSLARKYYSLWKTSNDQLKSALKSGEEDSKCHVAVLKEQNFTFPVAVTSVTMDKRFSESATSGPFKIVGETLNISSGL